MKKIIFIFALAILYSINANATDRDCVQYTTSEALAATSKDGNNTVKFVFSGMTARKASSNADCGTSSAEPAQESSASGTPSEPETPPTPATPPVTGASCGEGKVWDSNLDCVTPVEYTSCGGGRYWFQGYYDGGLHWYCDHSG